MEKTPNQIRFAELCKRILAKIVFKVQRSLIQKPDRLSFQFSISQSSPNRYNTIGGEWSCGDLFPLLYFKSLKAEERFRVQYGGHIFSKHVKDSDIDGAMKKFRTVFEDELRTEIIKGFSPTFDMIISSLLREDERMEQYASVWEYLEEIGMPYNVSDLRETFEAFDLIQLRRNPLRILLGADFDEMRNLAQDM